MRSNQFSLFTQSYNMKVFLAVSSLLAISAAAPAPDTPGYAPAAPQYADEPAKYAFNWAVKDDYTNNNYGQEETREGYATSGSYYVALPDGRLQKVTYSVNGDGGYVAEVSYEGTAQYPEAKPYAAASAPVASYAPAPAPPKYAPAPAPAKYAPAPAPASYASDPAPAPAPAYSPAPAQYSASQ
ncbi:cuticle protein 7 [Eurytemora carolleeae]|uniref:cuticle protein 7 n=1 Tax=Eurytemora carolleeae TaxID=1294199 RepID=UPI000C780129|nr:cuticle protein 7 [Eurytemora carolleeae]|eukprot:XP_023327997.1 cuticle protein 7-like [Eurytemora affinis]